jgi:hypothetical protein
MFHTIRSVTPEADYKLCLTYADGETVVVDFTPVIQRGGVFARLGDPTFFSQVSIGERGRYIQWPGELDFCADALWLEGHATESPAFNEQGEAARRT